MGRPPADDDTGPQLDWSLAEKRLTGTAHHRHPLLGVRMGVGVGDLVRAEALQGDVVALPPGDGNAAEAGGTPRKKILRE